MVLKAHLNTVEGHAVKKRTGMTIFIDRASFNTDNADESVAKDQQKTSRTCRAGQGFVTRNIMIVYRPALSEGLVREASSAMVFSTDWWLKRAFKFALKRYLGRLLRSEVGTLNRVCLCQYLGPQLAAS